MVVTIFSLEYIAGGHMSHHMFHAPTNVRTVLPHTV